MSPRTIPCAPGPAGKVDGGESTQPPAPLEMQVAMASREVEVTAASSNRSRSKRPTATPPGELIRLVQTGAPKVPVPVPRRVQSWLLFWQTRAMSPSMSPLMSPLATASGPVQPAGRSVFWENPPAQLLCRYDIVSSKLLVVTTSAHASLLKSAR